MQQSEVAARVFGEGILLKEGETPQAPAPGVGDEKEKTVNHRMLVLKNVTVSDRKVEDILERPGWVIAKPEEIGGIYLGYGH